jgi:ADP-heptose:LPS heptosyltransferase
LGTPAFVAAGPPAFAASDQELRGAECPLIQWPRVARRTAKTLFSLAWLLLDTLALGRRVPVQARTLLIVKTDALGDYLLFRNFLADIRSSERFRGWQITYLGWSACRELALSFDRDQVDDFIWIDRTAFMRRPSVRWSVMRGLRQRGFEVVFNPCSQRDLVVLDSLVRASAAPQRIGCGGDSVNRTWLDCLLGDRWYTALHRLRAADFFEFERNRAMVEFLVGLQPQRRRPELALISASRLRSRTVLVFPGARHPRRQWPAARLAELIDRMQRTCGARVVLCGGPGEHDLAADIAARSGGLAPENLVGRTSFSRLAELISQSCLVIVGDSGPLHLAAALDAPLICLSTANQLFRFTPYPEGMLSDAEFIFPPQVVSRWNEPEALRDEYGEYSSIEAADIPLETVWAAVHRSLLRVPATGQANEGRS